MSVCKDDWAEESLTLFCEDLDDEVLQMTQFWEESASRFASQVFYRGKYRSLQYQEETADSANAHILYISGSFW